MRCKRVYWPNLLQQDEVLEYKKWLKKRKLKVKSENKKVYLFLLHKYGRNWIVANRLHIHSLQEEIAIARVKWIKEVDE